MQSPTDIHLKAAHKIPRYIKNNPEQGQFYYGSSRLCLNAFSDANWGTCHMIVDALLLVIVSTLATP